MAEIIILGRMAKSYLVKEGNSSILIDTGVNFEKNFIYNKIKDENINLIIITHGHSDHFGNAEFLSKKFNADIGISNLDYTTISENLKPKLYSNDLFGKILKIGNEILDNSNKLKFEADFFLEDNDSIEKYDVNGINAVIHSLPGHTRGSMGVMVDDDKFIVGDAMMNHFSPRPASIYENKEDMFKSVDFIKNSKASMIYTGHGKPFKNK